MKELLAKIVIAASAFLATACLSPRTAEHTSTLRLNDLLFLETGKTSFYADSFDGKLTASGEVFNTEDFTAAHPSLPFGTILFVKKKSSSRFVLVRVNDRGPFRGNRRLDVSRAAAAKLGILLKGVATVDIYIVPERSHLTAIL